MLSKWREIFILTHTLMKIIAYLCLAFALTSSSLCAADKKIVLIAGKISHGPGEHEHNAGVLLLKKCLDNVPGVKAEAHLNGWPADAQAFDGASTILLFMDGGGGHGALQGDHLQQLDALMKKGVGLACVHYAVEPTIEKGQKEFLEWIGGAFEINWSVNPHWDANFSKIPKHPVTRGVKPFTINDEWYFNMRFHEGMKGVTPLLSAVPPESTMNRKDGTHEGNPAVREAVKRGDPQHVAWVYDREDGGRGFGFTGAHFHRNWGDENFRKLVLNAILWTAKADVPKGGVQSVVTEDDLKQNLDPKGQKASAANINGLWNFNVESPQGTGTPVFTFKQDGETLTGTYKGVLGESPVTGTIKGNNVKFSIKGKLQDEDLTVSYTGKVEGKDTMKGTVKFGELGEGTWNAKK